ncbi:MAG: ABC transporter permease subunit [Bacilli bacterium]|nr:ABC transporter permease subunit [Bacilli bacterium]
MFKREIKINSKSFILWTFILCTIFLVVFLLYPSLVKSDNIKMMDEILKIFPEDVLKSFNMDISSISTAFGWLQTEGLMLIYLVTGAYAAILGSNLILKEEDDKTIEYLHSLPITRTKIALSKIAAGLIYVVAMILFIGIFNYIGLIVNEDINDKTFFYLSISPLITSLVLFSLCMFISTFNRKTKTMMGISLGIVFGSYILNILSTISESIEFLKYFSIFALADTRNIIVNSSLNPVMLFISLALIIILLVLTIIKYNKKELV